MRCCALSLATAALLAGCGQSAPVGQGAVPPPSFAARPSAASPQGGSHTPYCARATPPAALGASELGRTARSGRALVIELASQALGRNESISVLLPQHFDASGATRYPVLYLLHGSLDSHLAYLDHDLETLVGNRPLIIVTPNDSANGSYSDWYGVAVGSSDVAPMWESFHVGEVIPWIEANFPTRTDRNGRLIAGLSSGGHGAMKYAAANPGLFGVAGSFSGAVNTTYEYPLYPTLSQVLGLSSLAPGTGPAADCTWGDFHIQQADWRDNDPTYLAPNLAGLPLWITGGDGTPGELDTVPYADPTEIIVYNMSLRFMQALDDAGIPHTNALYGAGTHTWPYWMRAVEQFLDWMTPVLTTPSTVPTQFDHRSARPAFSAWDWHFAITRDVQEFIYLQAVSASGLKATGSGLLQVLTAPLYAPGAPYRLEVDGTAQALRADAAGRLAFTLDLGAAHAEHQRQFNDTATVGWAQVAVRIHPESKRLP